MTKPVTAERIKKAIAHIEAARCRDKRMKQDSDIVQSLATYNLEGRVSRAFGEKEDPLTWRRVDMDLAYLEAPRSPEQLNILLSRWQQSIYRYGSKIERIRNIQRANGISGLVPCVTELGPHLIEHSWRDEDLVLIESDLEMLNEQKSHMAERWIDYAISNKLSFYKRVDGDWRIASPGEVVAAMPFYEWAEVWDDGEIHLRLGNGLDTDAAGVSIWFCATADSPSM